ncbi:MAG: EboA domain-containing protein [Flavobacteriaceae bacterium]|nr:EboA domain-containing protein [Flavobacteriaceae bacterium]
MVLSVSSKEVENVIRGNISDETFQWLIKRLETIISQKSGKDLFMTYSLLSAKIPDNDLLILTFQESLFNSLLNRQHAKILELARIYLLMRVLEADGETFTPKVATLIQVADKGELVAFLKFLAFLPNHLAFTHVAVEALRTNIADVFDAISLNNPFPAAYFNDQQWNQMYLKAAFMQRDLSLIMDVDQRANKELTRIISDYAHERWAASRDIDPLFWRPVAGFLDAGLLQDMERLLSSDLKAEQLAGGLCCLHSNTPEATELLNRYPDIKKEISTGEIGWESIKQIR